MWLSKEATAGVMKVSVRWVLVLIKEGKLKAKEVPSKKHKGKFETKIDLFSLPLEAQERYLKDNDKTQSIDDKNEDQDLLDLLQESKEIPKHQINKALERLNAAKEMESIHSSAAFGSKAEAVKGLAEKYNTPIRTLYRYYTKYQKCRNSSGLLAAFSDNRDTKKGKHYSVDQQTIDYIKYIYLQENRPRMMQVYKEIKAWCEQHKKPIPSYPTVTRIIKDIPKGALTFHRRGLKEWRHTQMPKIARTSKDLNPNDIWSGDHHELDIFIQYKGKPIRPWITVWQDLATRAIAGFNINLQPNSQTIGLALRHGILPKENKDYYMQGIPEQVYIDNGRDYRSHHLKGSVKTFRVDYDIHTKGIFADLNIKPRHARAYSPWSKPPERFFGTLTEQLVKTLPGWCGNKPENRPEKLASELKNMKILTLHDLKKIVEHWIIYEYHRNDHRGRGMENKFPNEMWADKTGPVKLPSERALDILLMKSKPLTVHPDGIHFMNNIYFNKSYEDFIPLIGHRVTVRYSPDRIGELFVFDNRKYICKATNQKLLTYDASEKDLKDVARMQKKAKETWVQYRKDLEERINTPDPVERVLKKREKDISVQEKIKKKQKQIALINEMEKISIEIAAKESKKEDELPEILVWDDQFKKREKLKAKRGGNI